MTISKINNRNIPDRFFELMQTLAKKDLRIGQMFDNVFKKIEYDGKDPYYLENDELLTYFDAVYDGVLTKRKE